jgi:hypothetical protein
MPTLPLKDRVDARAAGYMELNGAKKDADCEIVKVDGGISQYRGCCNLYSPFKGALKFDCGHCEYVIPN